MENTVVRVDLASLLEKKQESIEACVNALRKNSFVFLSLNAKDKECVDDAFASAKTFFSNNTEKQKGQHRIKSSKVGYKKSGSKERYQFRLSGSDYAMPDNPPEFKSHMFGIYKLFDKIGTLCLEYLLESLNIDWKWTKSTYCDPEPLPTSTFATSVFNVFHYFNTEDSLPFCNCPDHIDPGLITVLARSTIGTGLELMESNSNEWIPVEDSMREDEVMILAGETLQRLTDMQVKGALHRVGKSTASRINLIYELRPKEPIYYPWHQIHKGATTE